MIDLKHLRYFSTLAETLHFGRAAARLNLSQPPLSRQIASLEKELGVALFMRNSRSVTLTAAGKQYQTDAKAILAMCDQAAKNAVAAGRGQHGSLSVGFTSCAAYSVVPAFVRGYAAVYPEVQFRIRELLPDDLTGNLQDGAIDAAIMFPPEHHQGLNTRTVYTEPLCAVLPATHRLAHARSINIADLADDPFVIAPRRAAPSLYDTIMGHCQEGGFEPRVWLETSLQQTILNLVAERVGVALVPQSMNKAQLKGLLFKPLVEAPSVRLIIAWPKQERNPCLQGFLDLIAHQDVLD